MAQAIDQTFELLRQKFRKEMDAFDSKVINGQAQSYDDYKWLTGISYGIAIAESLMLELDQDLNGTDEE